MKFSRIFCTAALLSLSLGLSAGVALADGSDGRLGTKPVPPVDPPPACASVQFTADGTGAITGDSGVCEVANADLTEIDVIVPNADLGGVANLQLYSSLTSQVFQPFPQQFNWTNSCASAPSQSVNIGGVASQECKLIAPTMPTDFVSQLIIFGFTSANAIDTVQSCGESIFFVAAGCDLEFTTDAIGNQPGDVAGQFLSPNAQIDVTNGNTAGIAFMPEPGSLTLLAMGLAGLPFLRRKLAR